MAWARRAESATALRVVSTVIGVPLLSRCSNGDQSPSGKSSSWMRSAANEASNLGGERAVSSDPLPVRTLSPSASRIALIS